MVWLRQAALNDWLGWLMQLTGFQGGNERFHRLATDGRFVLQRRDDKDQCSVCHKDFQAR